MSETLSNYHEFLATKALTVASVGFEHTTFITPLFDFQSDIVRTAMNARYLYE